MLVRVVDEHIRKAFNNLNLGESYDNFIKSNPMAVGNIVTRAVFYNTDLFFNLIKEN